VAPALGCNRESFSAEGVSRVVCRGLARVMPRDRAEALTPRRGSPAVAEILDPGDRGRSSPARLKALTVRDPRSMEPRCAAVIPRAGPVGCARPVDSRTEPDVVRIPELRLRAPSSVPASPLAPEAAGLERRNTLRPFQLVVIRVGVPRSARRERLALEL